MMMMMIVVMMTMKSNFVLILNQKQWKKTAKWSISLGEGDDMTLVYDSILLVAVVMHILHLFIDLTTDMLESAQATSLARTG